MRVALLLAVTAVAALSLACQRPLAARTYVFALPGHAAYDHPADVREDQLDAALTGRVPADDRAAVARAAARAFGRLRPDQAIVYRHPDGGSLLFAVRGGALLVEPLGRRARTATPAAIELAGLRAATGPRKLAVPGEPGPGDAAYPQLEVEAAFAVPQVVFVGGTIVGTVPAGQTRTFRVPAGAAEVVVADDAEQRNAVRVQVQFENGRVERLSIQPEFAP